jgi:L-serine deaminase
MTKLPPVLKSTAAIAMTAKDMNPKYKETSEAGLAALMLC